MLNSFQLKLITFTKKMNRTKTKNLCKHTMSLLNRTEETTIKIPNKNSASTPCRVKLVSFLILKKMINLNQKNLKVTSSLIL